jgi:TPR repeat protein
VKTYQVVILGLKPGQNRDEALQRLAATFKQPVERLSSLVSGTRAVVKRGADIALAAKLQAAIEAAGFESIVEPEEGRAPIASAQALNQDVKVDAHAAPSVSPAKEAKVARTAPRSKMSPIVKYGGGFILVGVLVAVAVSTLVPRQSQRQPPTTPASLPVAVTGEPTSTTEPPKAPELGTLPATPPAITTPVAREQRNSPEVIQAAAEQGDARAQTALAERYVQGNGVSKDYAQAVMWFQKAAAQGDSLAENWLGRLYQTGAGVPADASRAAEWYRKSAEHGFAFGQYNFGMMLFGGIGLPKDAAQALVWFRKAADQGDVRSQYMLGVAYEDGKGVAKSEEQALAWYRKSAEGGDVKAQMLLARSYRDGKVAPKDRIEAAKWFRMAADNGEVEARYGYARMHMESDTFAAAYKAMLVRHEQCLASGNRLCVGQCEMKEAVFENLVKDVPKALAPSGVDSRIPTIFAAPIYGWVYDCVSQAP